MSDGTAHFLASLVGLTVGFWIALKVTEKVDSDMAGSAEVLFRILLALASVTLVGTLLVLLASKFVHP